ncbi:MAG: HemK/PrmC family methyltransferase [bacterium]
MDGKPYFAKTTKGKEEPIAYTIGWQPFLGLKIYLDSRPLIPRPETEWWTEQLLTNVGHLKSYIKFLDLCAGSGAIGCAALARLPNAEVFFGEIDPAHETTILKNIRENNLDKSRSHICIGDLFEPFSDMQFDIIAVNPPYIPADRELPKSVADYEPALALRSGIDGLDLIRRIAASTRRRLVENGVLWCECDSPTAETARALFEEQGLNAKILNDQYDQPRVICARMI